MMQLMVGASPDERALSPVRLAVKKRQPWLNINLLTAFIAASVVGFFESTIAQVTSLAILLPVVAGQSGNSAIALRWPWRLVVVDRRRNRRRLDTGS